MRFCYKKLVFIGKKTNNSRTRTVQMSVCKVSLLPLISQAFYFAEKMSFLAPPSGRGYHCV